MRDGVILLIVIEKGGREMKSISEKLKDGIVETIKMEGVGMTIGCAISSLFLILMGLKLLAICLFVIAILLAWTLFPITAVISILLNEYYRTKQLRNGIIS